MTMMMNGENEAEWIGREGHIPSPAKPALHMPDPLSITNA